MKIKLLGLNKWFKTEKEGIELIKHYLNSYFKEKVVNE